MTPAITRLYDHYEDAAAAVAELEAAGVPHHDISLIANNAEGRHLSEGRRDGIADSEIGEDAGKGATTGGLLGGGAGLLAGLGMLAIPGVGPRTRQRLLEHFGSVRGVRQAAPDALTAVVNAATAAKIRSHFAAEAGEGAVLPVLN